MAPGQVQQTHPVLVSMTQVEKEQKTTHTRHAIGSTCSQGRVRLGGWAAETGPVGRSPWLEALEPAAHTAELDEAQVW